MLAELPISEFLAETSAGTAVPGGGSVAALSAAAAAGLVEMVANLTIGRKDFEAGAETMRNIAARARNLRVKLLEDMDRDAQAYTRVLEAFRLPKGTREEQDARRTAVQEALKEAATVPFEVAGDARSVLDLADEVIARGNPNAVTDGAVGAMLARTAGLSALYNVRVNLTSIRDEAFVGSLRSKVKTMEDELIRKEQGILARLDLRHPVGR